MECRPIEADACVFSKKMATEIFGTPQ